MRGSKTFKKIFPRKDSDVRTPDEQDIFVSTKDFSTHSSDEKDAFLFENNKYKKVSMFYSGKMSIKEVAPTQDKKIKMTEDFPDLIQKTLRKENQKQFIKFYGKTSDRQEYYENLRKLCKSFNTSQVQKEIALKYIKEVQDLKDVYYNKKGGLVWRSDNFILTSNSVCTKKGESIYFGRGNYLVKWNSGLRRRDLAFEQNQWGKGHKDTITTVAVTMSGNQLVSGGKDGTLIFWDLSQKNSSKEEIFSPDPKLGTSDIILLPSTENSTVECVQFSHDGRSVVFARKNSVISWWVDSNPAKTVEYIHKERVFHAACSRNNYLASGGDDMIIRVWKDQKDKPKNSYKINEKVLNSQKLLGHTGKILAVKFSVDGNSLLSCSEDKSIKLWEFESNKFLFRTDFEGHNRAVTSIEFSPVSSGEFVSGSADFSIILWSISKRSKIKAFVGHQSPIVSVAYSLDGSKILSASSDNMLRLWNVALSYKPLTFENINSEITQIVFSPDGSYLFLRCQDNIIRMFSMENDQKKSEDAVHFKSEIDDPQSFNSCHSLSSMGLSFDASDIIAGSEEGKVILWNRESKKRKISYQSHKGAIYFVSQSPDGSKILSGGKDSLIKLWNIEDLTEIITLSKGPAENCEALAGDFSPDGCRVICAYSDNVIQLWDLITGKPSWMQEKIDSVNVVIFFNNENKVVSGGKDTLIYIWDLKKNDSIPFKSFKGHSGPVISLSILQDDSRLISGSTDNTLNLWDTQTGAKISTFTGHSDKVHSVCFSYNGTKVYSGSMDKTVRVWDGLPRAEIKAFSGHSDSIKCVAFDSQGSKIATGAKDRSLRIWSSDTGMELRNFSGLPSSVTSLSFSPDGTLVATGMADRCIRVWDYMNKRKLVTIRDQDLPSILSVCFSPDGQKIAFAGEDNSVWIYETETWKRVGKYSKHSGWIYSVGFSPNSDRLVTGSWDKNVIIYKQGVEKNDYESFVTCIGHMGAVHAVAFSFNERDLSVISGSEDKTVRIWEASTGEQIRVLRGHKGSVYSVNISRIGNLIVSASEDKFIRVWDFASGVQVRAFEESHTTSINSVAISPDSSKLASGCAMGILNLYDLNIGKKTQKFTGHELAVTSITLSVDGFKIISGGRDGYIMIWDVMTGEQIMAKKIHKRSVTTVVSWREGSLLLSGSEDGEIKLLNGHSLAEVKVIDFKMGPLNSIEFSPDGFQFVATFLGKKKFVYCDLSKDVSKAKFSKQNACITFAGFFPDGSKILTGIDTTDTIYSGLIIWDIDKLGMLTTMESSEKCTGVSTFCITHDGTKVISAHNDNIMRLWDCITKRLIRLYQGHEGRICSISFNPQNNMFISGSWDKTIKVWRTKFENPVETLVAHTGKVLSVKFSHRGLKFFSTGWDSQIIMWDSQTFKKIRNYSTHKFKVSCLNFSPSGNKVATGSEDNSIIIWDFQNCLLGDKAKEVFQGHTGAVSSVNFSFDGKKLVSCGADKLIFVWNITTDRKRLDIRSHVSTVCAAKFLADNESIVSGAMNGSIMISNLDKVKCIYMNTTFLTAHEDSVNAIDVCADGKTIISGSSDNNLKLWKLNDLSKPVFIARHPMAVTCLSFSTDYRILVSGCEDKIVREWDALSGALIRTMHAQSAGITSVGFSYDGSKVISANRDNLISTYHEMTGELSEVLQGGQILALNVNNQAAYSNGVGFNLVSDFIEDKSIWILKEDKIDISDSFKLENDFSTLQLNVLSYPVILPLFHHLILFDDKPEIWLEKFKNCKMNLENITINLIFTVDSFGLSAWDYCTFASEACRVGWLSILKYLFLNLSKNQRLNSIRVNHFDLPLCTMLSYFPSDFQQFLDNFICESPIFSREADGNDKLMLSDTVWLNYDSLSKKTQSSSIVQCKAVLFTYHLDVNSLLLEKISELASDHPVFKSELVTVSLRYLWWDYIWKIFKMHLIFSLLFLIFVSANLFYFNLEKWESNDRDYKNRMGWISFGIEVVILLYLLLQIIQELRELIFNEKNNLIGKLKKHFSNFWNILDFLTIASGVFSNALDVILFLANSDSYPVYMKIISTYFFFLCWIRILYFARGFEKTSALIRLLIKVFQDMYAFLLVLFFLMIGFSLTAYLIQNHFNEFNPASFIKSFYYMLYGDFNMFNDMAQITSINLDFNFVYLLLTTVFLDIVMLNLLIAYISDSFEKLMAVNTQAFNYERLRLVLEYKRQVRSKHLLEYIPKRKLLYYLQNEHKSVDEDVNERLRLKIDRLEQKLDRNGKEVKQFKESYLENFNKLYQILSKK